MIQEIELICEPIHILEQKYRVTPVNFTEMEVLDNLFRNDPSCQACFSSVCNFIGGGGVRLTKKNRDEFKISSAVQRSLNTHWMVFGKDLIRNLWCYGFVMVDMDEKQQPYCLDPILHVMHLVTGDKGFRRIQITPKLTRPTALNSTPIKTARVYFESMPHHTGNIQSKVASLRQMSSVQNLMIGCMTRAAMRRCVPPLVTEHNPINAAQNQMQRDMAQIGDHEDFVLANTEQVDEHDVDQVRANSERQARMNLEMDAPRIENHDPVTGAPRYPADGAESFFHSRVIIESGKHLVAGPLSEAPPDTIEIMSITEADAAKIFGVPPGLWGSQRSAVAVDEMIMVVFNATLLAVKEFLVYIFEDMLEAAHGENNRAHTRENLDLTKTVDENLEDHRFCVSFPGLQDADTIQRFLDTGMMEWDVIKHYAKATFGVPLTDWAKQLVNAATGEPLKVEAEREQEMQEKQLQNDIKVTQAKIKTEGTVAVKNLASATAAKRKGAPTSSSKSSKRKKTAKTKKKNAQSSTASKSKRKINK